MMVTLNYKKDILLVLLLIFVSFFVLSFRLNDLPSKVSLDEIRNAGFSASLNNHSYIPYYAQFFRGWDTHNTFPLYNMLGSMKAFGASPFSLRFSGIVYGVLTVVVTYYFLSFLFGKYPAFLGALTLAFSYKFIAFSRWAIETPFYFLFLALSLLFFSKYCLSLVKKEGKSNYLILFLLSLSVGMLQHTYGSARMYLFTFPLILLFVMLRYRIGLFRFVLSILVFASGLVIIMYPLIIASKNLPKEAFDSRGGDLQILRDAAIKDKLWSIKWGFIKTIGMFNIKGSSESCYSYSGSKFLDPLSGVLFILGALVFLVKYRYLYSGSILALFTISLLPSVFSLVGATPHEVRASGAIVFIPVFITSLIVSIQNIVSSHRSRLIFIAGGLLFIGIYNLNSYFVRQVNEDKTCYIFPKEKLVETVNEYYNLNPKPFLEYNPWY